MASVHEAYGGGPLTPFTSMDRSLLKAGSYLGRGANHSIIKAGDIVTGVRVDGETGYFFDPGLKILDSLPPHEKDNASFIRAPEDSGLYWYRLVRT